MGGCSGSINYLINLNNFLPAFIEKFLKKLINHAVAKFFQKRYNSSTTRQVVELWGIFIVKKGDF